MQKLDFRSKDIVAENVNRIKDLFPEAFCEDRIDFERLQEILGEYIEDRQERYRFEWNGKSRSIKLAQTPSTGTLRPSKEESKNWDTTENMYIEGDNLEVLKLLQKTYHNRIKMIYIDPPYNTGKDFVYPDDYRDNLRNYLEITGQVDEEGRKISTNSEGSGRYHTDWLNMMYPRLRLAKNLLSDDGAIFISIDDIEINNLRKMCDELFGEQNFISAMIWSAGRKNDSKYISNSHEYIVIYAKNKGRLLEDGIVWRQKKEGLDEIYKKVDELVALYKEDYSQASKDLVGWYRSLSDGHPSKKHKHYKCIDNRGIYFPADISWPGGGGPKYDIYHPITGKKCKIPARGWVFSSIERMNEEIKKGNIHFGIDENIVPCRKMYLKDKEYQVPYSVIYKDNRAAMKRLRELFGGVTVFDYPKDEEILCDLISFLTKEEDVVLDFFSGSAATAHAVMQLNIEDRSKRKFIMVQLQEPCDEKSEAYKVGYENICEIGKERIRKAGDKIVEKNKNKEGIENLDTGFKVFKLDSSNLKKWNPDYDNLELTFDNMINNFVDGRTQEDVLYEIMLKYGIDLTYPVEELEINGKKIFSIGFGALIVCLDDDITLDVVEGIASLKEELCPEVIRVVFKDNGFKSDSVKTNAIQILRRNGIEEIMSV